MTTNDVAWLAGLVEGEGCISIQRRRAGNSILLKIAMTDRDVIERAANLFGSAVRSRRGATERHKDVYTTTIWGGAAAGWIADLYAQLGTRRQAKAQEALTAYSLSGGHHRREGLCKRGHFIIEPGATYRDKKTGQQWCRQCKLMLMKQKKGKLPRMERNAA